MYTYITISVSVCEQKCGFGLRHLLEQREVDALLLLVPVNSVEGKLNTYIIYLCMKHIYIYMHVHVDLELALDTSENNAK